MWFKDMNSYKNSDVIRLYKSNLERALHKKCNQIPMVVAQRLISSMLRLCVDACGVKRRSFQILSNDVTFEARPLHAI